LWCGGGAFVVVLWRKKCDYWSQIMLSGTQLDNMGVLW